jgi:hypothetical protein
MRQIRQCVFETNSSSTHSLVVRGRGRPLSDFFLHIEDDGYVHTSFGEFGWGYDVLYGQDEKLSYLCTMAACADSSMASNDDFYKNPEFQAINDVIKEKCGCRGLIIDTLITKKVSKDGVTSWTVFDGYVDHQSAYGSLQAFLDDYGVTIEQVIFSPAVEIIIDNDNY